MNISYAVDRLYEEGWQPSETWEMEELPDGRKYPSVESVRREFGRAGLLLALKQNLIFNCCRATWGPIGEALDSSHAADGRHGTVVGECEREAAVYALAQLQAGVGGRSVVMA